MDNRIDVDARKLPAKPPAGVGAGVDGVFTLLSESRVVGQTIEIPPNGISVSVIQANTSGLASQLFTVSLLTEPAPGITGNHASLGVATIEFGAGNTALAVVEIDTVQGASVTVPGSYVRVSIANNGADAQRFGAFVSYYPFPRPSRATRTFITPAIAAAGVAVGDVPAYAQDVVVYIGPADAGAIGAERDFRFDITGLTAVGTIGQTILGSQQMRPMPVVAGSFKWSLKNLDASSIPHAAVVFGIAP